MISVLQGLFVDRISKQLGTRYIIDYIVNPANNNRPHDAACVDGNTPKVTANFTLINTLYKS
jgi:hypothetical protein